MKKLLPLLLCLLCSCALAAESGSWQLSPQSDEPAAAYIDLAPVDEWGGTMSLTPTQTVTGVTLSLLTWNREDRPEETVLWQGDSLSPGQGLHVTCALGDVLPNLQIACLNEEGERECLYITDSGEDGSLMLIPEAVLEEEWLGHPVLAPGSDMVYSGRLMQVCYSRSGDIRGILHELTLERQSGSGLVLELRESSGYLAPLTLSRYAADEDLLIRIADLVTAWDMEQWAKRPDDLVAWDAAHPRLTLVAYDAQWQRHSLTISGWATRSQEEDVAWQQLLELLSSQMTPSQLLDTHTEPRRLP